MNGTFIIVGDFNLPDIWWRDGRAGTKGQKFLETINNRFLTQHVESATHDGGNILHLVISSEDELVREVELYGNVGKSDHAMIKYAVQADVKEVARRKKVPELPTGENGRDAWYNTERLERDNGGEKCQRNVVDTKEVAGRCRISARTNRNDQTDGPAKMVRRRNAQEDSGKARCVEGMEENESRNGQGHIREN